MEMESVNDKINRYVNLLVKAPDFTTNVYDDPKGMYEEYGVCISDIAKAIESAGIALAKHVITTAMWDTDKHFKYSMDGNTTSINRAVTELTQNAQNLKTILDALIEIVRDKFEAIFEITDPKYESYNRSSPKNKVFIFDDKTALLTYLRINEVTFNALETQPLSDTTFPLLTNTLRFHGLQRTTSEFRAMRIFEAIRNCTELENGKWAIISGV
jgi:hypothetical protein